MGQYFAILTSGVKILAKKNDEPKAIPYEFTAIPNFVIDKLMQCNLSNYERRIIDVIMRETYGYHRKHALIKLDDFVSHTGLSKSHIVNALTKLISKEIITYLGKSNAAKYCINADIQAWIILPKQVKAKEHIRPKGKGNAHQCIICGNEIKNRRLWRYCGNECKAKSQITYLGNEELPNEVKSVTYLGNQAPLEAATGEGFKEPKENLKKEGLKENENPEAEFSAAEAAKSKKVDDVRTDKKSSSKKGSSAKKKKEKIEPIMNATLFYEIVNFFKKNCTMNDGIFRAGLLAWNKLTEQQQLSLYALFQTERCKKFIINSKVALQNFISKYHNAKEENLFIPGDKPQEPERKKSDKYSKALEGIA